MKRIRLLITALVPVVAIASEQAGTQQRVDHQHLRSHAQVTNILGAEVRSDAGNSIGRVEDIVFDRQGNVSFVLVQRQDVGAEAGARTPENSGAAMEDDGGYATTGMSESEMAEVRAARRERAVREGMAMENVQDTGDAASSARSGALAMLRWSEVSYDAAEQILRLAAPSALQTAEYGHADEEVMQDDQIRASTLVGLDVSLANEDSFGEVEDIMIDHTNGKASALVVDTMEFFDKERYALPVELHGLDADVGSLTLRMTQQQVEQMGEFEMEEASTR